ncbi:alpha-hydroxy-acid oxidizing protein [Streptomyces sp. NPDC020802]|uniref:alpha-hydroxy-acid oxidizing protein n=1 Tax=Streptomyces sp. NPDC020802 TaxID=3365094 RepID=UPI00378F0421
MSVDIAAAATGPLWLQLYWLKHRDLLVDLIRRAEAAGFRALVLTVDASGVALCPRDAANGFAVPPGIRAVNVAHNSSTPRSPGRTSPGYAQ